LLVAFAVGGGQGAIWVSWYQMVCLYPVPVLEWFVAQVAVSSGTFHGSCSASVISPIHGSLLCFTFGAVYLDRPVGRAITCLSC
jgi:hypothetical protein